MIINLNSSFPPAADGSQGPLPKQKQFMDLVLDSKGPKFVGYFGGYGSGKSLILCITMITQAVVYGGDYVISRMFMPELRRTTMKLFLELCPKELIVEYRAADAEVHLRSASGKPAVIYFVGLDSPEKLDSLNLSGFAIDEASQTTDEAFLKLQGRLRNPLGLRKGILVGNPKGKNWVYTRFVSKTTLNDEASKSQYAMIVAPSTENVHLPAGYVESMLASYSPERIQRDIYGSWDSFEGQIYTEFQRSIHVIKPFEIPSEWPRFAGMDHGYTNPAACVWGAIDFDGNIYLYKEFYESGLTIKEICKELLRINAKDKLDTIYIDPSTKAVRSQTGSSDFDAYLDNLPKEIGLLPAKNDVTQGIDRVKTYLKINEKSKKPRLYFFNTLINTIDEITQYQWEELGPGLQGRVNEKEKPKKYKDHACDAARYLLMSRPEDPRPVVDLHKGRYPTSETLIQEELKRIKSRNKLKDPFGDF